ncbi:MAG: MoaD/ThiS family protein [Thermoplasmata archaeon]|nr:MoaD/ThiS family protein [Thermoplasmata archaeon]MCI4337939.1 MoaD/ThiS family protein [Thermoplasmata archaeon]MCI4341758.1 MoaD/ThiS family protein [Thermoplasmata archaeon]
MPRPLTVLLFAGAREAVGRGQVDLLLAGESEPVEDVLARLRATYPRLSPLLAVSRLVRNGEYLRGNRGRLRPGDELAIHPPYSGG